LDRFGPWLRGCFDFLKANVVAGRTYYVNVIVPGLPTVSIGESFGWPSIASYAYEFRPLSRFELDSKNFAAWDARTKFVVMSPEAEAWAAKNAQWAAQAREGLSARRYSPRMLDVDDGR
jgi:hypothetical protein